MRNPPPSTETELRITNFEIWTHGGFTWPSEEVYCFQRFMQDNNVIVESALFVEFQSDLFKMNNIVLFQIPCKRLMLEDIRSRINVAEYFRNVNKITVTGKTNDVTLDSIMDMSEIDTLDILGLENPINFAVSLKNREILKSLTAFNALPIVFENSDFIHGTFEQLLQRNALKVVAENYSTFGFQFELKEKKITITRTVYALPGSMLTAFMKEKNIKQIEDTNGNSYLRGSTRKPLTPNTIDGTITVIIGDSKFVTFKERSAFIEYCKTHGTADITATIINDAGMLEKLYGK